MNIENVYQQDLGAKYILTDEQRDAFFKLEPRLTLTREQRDFLLQQLNIALRFAESEREDVSAIKLYQMIDLIKYYQHVVLDHGFKKGTVLNP